MYLGRLDGVGFERYTVARYVDFLPVNNAVKKAGKNKGRTSTPASIQTFASPSWAS